MVVFIKRRGWDSNPRALSDKRFSRPPRYDHFDTSPTIYLSAASVSPQRQVVGIAGVLMTITCWLCFATTKETCIKETEKKPLLEEIKTLFRVKGLLYTILVWLAAYISYCVMMSSSVYYIMYCLCRPDHGRIRCCTDRT